MIRKFFCSVWLLLSLLVSIHGFLGIACSPEEESSFQCRRKQQSFLGWDSHHRPRYCAVDSSHTAVSIPQEVRVLLERAGIPVENVTRCNMMKETSAYCNSLYRLTLLDELDENHTVIAKVFSQLALQRMEPFRQTGDIDRRVAVEGLGPAILATTDGAILMEDCSAGRVLTEEDVHSENAATISKSVALSLAHLHHLAEESAVRHENMLWRACDVMFSLSDRNWKVADWNIDRLCRSLQTHREQLEKEDPVQVDFGHGDCKPSNVLFFPTASGSPQILFIDWEISGKHYRAFDLAKFLRADQPTAHTEKNRRFFLKAYAAASQRLVDKKTTVVVASDNLVDTLEREVSLLTPLTWLEAALFFVCMSTQDPLQEKKWNDLALDRLKSYERCCHSLKTAADGP